MVSGGMDAPGRNSRPTLDVSQMQIGAGLYIAFAIPDLKHIWKILEKTLIFLQHMGAASLIVKKAWAET